MFSGDEIKKEDDSFDVKKEILEPVEFFCNICSLKFLDEMLYGELILFTNLKRN